MGRRRAMKKKGGKGLYSPWRITSSRNPRAQSGILQIALLFFLSSSISYTEERGCGLQEEPTAARVRGGLFRAGEQCPGFRTRGIPWETQNSSRNSAARTFYVCGSAATLGVAMLFIMTDGGKNRTFLREYMLSGGVGLVEVSRCNWIFLRNLMVCY